MATTKPDLTRVWANGAPPANVVDPDTTTPGKVLSGWQAEVPPFEHFNFLQKWFTQGLAHFNEQGIGIWDTETTYPVDGLAKGSDGEIYIAVSEQSNNNPVSDNGTNWINYSSNLLSSSDLNFANISDLKNGLLNSGKPVNLSALPENTKISWMGYHSRSDGGSNWGRIRFGAHIEDSLKIFSIDTNTYVESNTGGKKLNVRKGGVIGDNTTADFNRLQNIIDWCAEKRAGVAQIPLSKTVYFPFQGGGYTFNTPINMTEDNGQTNRRGIEFKGDSEPAGGDWGYGTKLIFATNGKAMIEIVDSDAFTLNNLVLEDTGDSTGASVGIYQARRTGGTLPSQWTGNAKFKNSCIRLLNDDRTLNNNFGAIGVINISGEETTYDDLEVWANLPLVLSYSSTFRKMIDSAPPAEGSAYDSFEYDPVHVDVADITEGFSNTVFRTKNCRFIAKGRNAPTVLLHEIGSYFPQGDFLQKRASTHVSGNGTNSTAYECWNVNQMVGDSICESHRTLMMFHRQAGQIKMNLRGADDGIGNSAIGLIHFAPDAPGFAIINSDITIDYPGVIPGPYISYTRPASVGVLEPSVFKLKNSDFSLNKNYDKNFISTKTLYVCENCTFNLNDFNMEVGNRKIKFPLKSKSIGTPATTTDVVRVEIPDVAAGFNGQSFTVDVRCHVSNAEVEVGGSPSSLGIDARWQFTRDQNATSHAIGSATFNGVTASVLPGANNITGLTLSETVTSNKDIFLKMATIQSGANNAEAYLSGFVEVSYAGGYASAPIVSLL